MIVFVYAKISIEKSWRIGSCFLSLTCHPDEVYLMVSIDQEEEGKPCKIYQGLVVQRIYTGWPKN